MTSLEEVEPGLKTADRIARMLVRHRRRALLLVLAMTLALAAGLGRLAFDFSPDRMYPRSDPTRIALDRYREAFPRHDGRAIVLVESATDLLAPASLARLRALTDELAALPLVQEVASLTTAQVLRSDAEGIALVLAVDERSDELLVHRQRLQRDPLLADRLVGPDAAWLAVEVDLVPEENTDLGRVAFRDVLAEVVDRHRGSFDALTLTGVPVLQAGYMDLSGQDQGLLLPVMVLLAVTLLYGVFRDRLDAVLPVAIMLLASVCMMGAMGWAGAPLSFLSAAMPVILLVIGVSDVLHVMAAYERARAGRSDAPCDEDSAAEALAYTLSACAMTSLTTAIGFLAIVATGIPMLVDFGIYTAFGVVATYGLTMLLIPNVLLRRRRASPATRRMNRRGMERFFVRMAAAVERRPVGIALAVTGVALAISAGAARVSTEALMFDDLMPGTELRKTIDRVDERYGVLSLGIWVETDEADGIATPRGLATLDAVAEALRSIPEARAVLSPVDLVRELHQAFLADAEESLPTTPEAVRQELLLLSMLGPDLLESFIVPDRSSARVVARIPDLGSGRMGSVLDELTAALAPLATEGLSIELSGQTVVAQDVIRQVRQSLASSLGLAFVLIAGLCLVMYRSLALALIALLPNALTIAVLMGLLGWVGFPLKTSMILVFCITLSIAVDDTIHVLARFKHAGAGRRGEHAALRALRDTAVPMTWTSVVLGAGFLVLTLSRFMGLTQMGVWVTVSLAIAWALDLVLLPALLVLYERRRGPK